MTDDAGCRPLSGRSLIFRSSLRWGALASWKAGPYPTRRGRIRLQPADHRFRRRAPSFATLSMAVAPRMPGTPVRLPVHLAAASLPDRTACLAAMCVSGCPLLPPDLNAKKKGHHPVWMMALVGNSCSCGAATSSPHCNEGNKAQKRQPVTPDACHPQGGHHSIYSRPRSAPRQVAAATSMKTFRKTTIFCSDLRNTFSRIAHELNAPTAISSSAPCARCSRATDVRSAAHPCAPGSDADRGRAQRAHAAAARVRRRTSGRTRDREKANKLA